MNAAELIREAKKLSPAEVESLIADLMDLRAEMSPPVSDEPPKPDGTSAQNVAAEDDPSISARLLKDKRVRLWIRSSGIGWLVFNLSHRTSATLRDWLIANTDRDSVSELFSEQGSKGGPH